MRRVSLALVSSFLRAPAICVLVLGACSRPAGNGAPATAPSESVAKAPPPPAASSVATPTKADDKKGEACGELGCRAFESSQEAFSVVLESQPAVLGIGEAHAQKGTEDVPSSTKRFTDEMLPSLQKRASFLLVELMMPNPKCKKETKQVAKQQEPVTKPQAATNKNEYLVLGEKAKSLGITPDLLRPSCEDLERITKAGSEDISVMLEMTAKLTTQVVESELTRNQKAHKPLLVVAYGGALHNDISPRTGREKWSYGPDLSDHTAGRYVELDLIVPEYIKDAEPWTSLPWVKHYDRDKLGKKAVLFEVAPKSFVMVLPASS
jgi:hypothetical protein